MRSTRRIAALAATVAGTLALGTSAAGAAVVVNVNPVTGKDTNAGSATAPLKTIGAALEKARSGDTVKLASGVYSAKTNGERYTAATGPSLVVPAGVAVAGQSNLSLPPSVLDGEPADTVGLELAGDASVSSLQLKDVRDGIHAGKGTQTLKGVDFLNSRLAVNGTARTTYTTTVAKPIQRGGVIVPGANGAAVAFDDARLSITGVPVSGGAPNCDLAKRGVRAGNHAQVTLDGMRFDNIPANVVEASNLVKATVRNTTVATDLPAGCFPGVPALRNAGDAQLSISASTLTSTSRTLSFAVQAGGPGPVTVADSTIKGWGAGVRTGSAASAVKITGSRLLSNAIGVNASASPAAFVDIGGSHLDDGVNGILAGALRLRQSTVERNTGTGIILQGPLADLGQPGLPGANTLRLNGGTSLRIAASVAAAGVFAVGNTWEPTQGADALGHYGSKTLNGLSPGVVGRNFTLPASSGHAIQF